MMRRCCIPEIIDIIVCDDFRLSFLTLDLSRVVLHSLPFVGFIYLDEMVERSMVDTKAFTHTCLFLCYFHNYPHPLWVLYNLRRLS